MNEQFECSEMGFAKVALDMEMMTSTGSYVFSNNEYLKQGQIKSYFSRLTLKQRSMQEGSFNQQNQHQYQHRPQYSRTQPV